MGLVYYSRSFSHLAHCVILSQVISLVSDVSCVKWGLWWMFKDCSPPFLISLTYCTPEFFSHEVWVRLTSFLAPMMGSSLGQIAGGTLSAHDWFRNVHWSKTAQSEGTLGLLLERLRHRLCFYWMWIQNHVALRTAAGHLLTQWGEKLLKNGTNIKENGLLLRKKKEERNQVLISKYECWIKLCLMLHSSLGHSVMWTMNSFYCLNFVL